MDESSEISGLLRRAAEGDVQAIDALFARYETRLKRMVRLRMNRTLSARVDVSDVLQDAYVVVAKSLAEYLRNPSLPFFLWLRHITGQKLIEIHRRHLGAQARDAGRDVLLGGAAGPEATSENLAAQLIGRLSSPSSAAQKAELRARVQAALDGLDPIDREILSLRHFEQLSNVETAALLGLAVPSASSRYVRALKRLKSALKGVAGLFDSS
ncbi:MAG TPA: sigma-70 family RNA polymerase sigma factor [Pirellulales bacterium]|nr:sigma-70 family RNA polymerase sigma factor [Pirellulales bacterium]